MVTLIRDRHARPWEEDYVLNFFTVEVARTKLILPSLYLFGGVDLKKEFVDITGLKLLSPRYFRDKLVNSFSLGYDKKYNFTYDLYKLMGQ